MGHYWKVFWYLFQRNKIMQQYGHDFTFPNKDTIKL